jgi:hypothetical protein
MSVWIVTAERNYKIVTSVPATRKNASAVPIATPARVVLTATFATTATTATTVLAVSNWKIKNFAFSTSSTRKRNTKNT